MTRKKKQAVKTEELHANKAANIRFLLRVAYLTLGLSLILWAWSMMQSSNFFPLKQVIIKGEYNEVDPNSIKSILQPYLNTGLLQLKTGTLRQELQDLPWVETAELDRDWPNTLVIVLTEKIPVARWRNNALITAAGEVFFPPTDTIPKNLPVLETSSNLITEGIALLQEVKIAVASINLQVKSLILTQRQTLSLTLQSIPTTTDSADSNSNQGTIQVLLGEEDIQNRLNRFISVYPKVFANRLNQVEYADMRYTNGMAVKWKQNPITNK